MTLTDLVRNAFKLFHVGSKEEKPATPVSYSTDHLRKLSEIRGLDDYVVIHVETKGPDGVTYNIEYSHSHQYGWVAELHRPESAPAYSTVEGRLMGVMDNAEKKNLSGKNVINPKENITLAKVGDYIDQFGDVGLRNPIITGVEFRQYIRRDLRLQAERILKS